jgi:hypothetical protein
MRGLAPFAAVALLCASPLSAQQQPAGAPANVPAVKPIEQEEAPAAAPKAGANSFTERQARDRIQDHGYTVTGNLLKDGNGVWHAQVTKAGGESLMVALDYQGRLTEEQPYTTHPTTPLHVAPPKAPAQSGSTAGAGRQAPAPSRAPTKN